MGRGRVDLAFPYVLHMDETLILFQKSSKKVIAPIGLEEVIVDCQKNDKECFTALGTIDKNRTPPLFFIQRNRRKMS